MLSTGTTVPAFKLEGSGGRTVSSEDISGRFAVIVFYPKNNTPG